MAALRIYPLKSAAALEVDSIEVELAGPRGDRRWMLVDARGRFLSQRRHPALATVTATATAARELTIRVGHQIIIARAAGSQRTVSLWQDTVTVERAEESANQELSATLGMRVEIVHLPDDRSGSTGRTVDDTYAEPDSPVSLADGFPFLLTNVESLRDIETAAQRTLAMSRFRSNIIVEGVSTWAEESHPEISIGPVRFLNPKRCRRCVTVNVDQQTGHRDDPALLQDLFAIRPTGQFGTNLVPLQTGLIRIGDPVTMHAVRPRDQDQDTST